ncbi:MAG: type II toxin-antitoxin system RelE/ParE family toxin [Saprospiraceae bacterium]|uniref:Type II toxin-antitoxin system RelE/ParE family toxin n=1 Tax=Candidatus Defluviibacterium haderslevense TaxID=2981993 RepID=A0A9D7SCQ1_9BACT|nr:type II toxin-antitoxin system RelE/ParE family toxin [Candidatus Defluviibacterium haderslevense]MBK7245568.1 type II toxin-antitoxin system RelE/ParE family toxin [Candidatus Defluviibacterium haderslevense]MBK8244348.1 type II toxin-antitoxin system RelE/ParE family toxin [Candidatus Defluviibacterium haderslevense]MBK9719534.1 type II toxin-antitoxin system RelE/ParE family toxin [Candidatus Defluviibacterium haderslevense]MBL0237923.1 type II toxin-antitoxin system RelE/ParE family toxi
MVRKIIWSKRATSNLASLTEYLNQNWSENLAKQFVQRTFELVELLSKQPNIGPYQNSEKKIRGILISKHNRLFYRTSSNKIIILSIFDTRSNPKKQI